MDYASMTREQLLAEYANLGFDVSVITDVVSDDALRQILQAAVGAAEAETPAAEEATEAATEEAPAETPAEETPAPEEAPVDAAATEPVPEEEEDEEMAAFMDAMGAEGATDEEKEEMKLMMEGYAKRYAERQARKMSEGAKKKPAVAKHSETKTAKQVRVIEKRLNRLDAETARRLRRERRQNVQSFCERLSNEGKIPPALIGFYVEHAMTLDAGRVQKFSEGPATQLANFMRGLEKSPVIMSFAERLKAPKRKDGKDHEEAKVEQHFERFSEQYRKSGTTKDALLAGFRNYRKDQERRGLEANADTFLRA